MSSETGDFTKRICALKGKMENCNLIQKRQTLIIVENFMTCWIISCQVAGPAHGPGRVSDRKVQRPIQQLLRRCHQSQKMSSVHTGRNIFKISLTHRKHDILFDRTYHMCVILPNLPSYKNCQSILVFMRNFLHKNVNLWQICISQ